MAKAYLILPNGTKVEIDGSPEEIKKILGAHGAAESRPSPDKQVVKAGAKATNLTDIVNMIKTCKEADLIGKNILDRISQVDRVLLPLYITESHFQGDSGITSGEISKILAQLGIGIHAPNISNTLSSTASKYVLGDKIRKRGQPVRYRISRKGLDYINSAIKGKGNG